MNTTCSSRIFIRGILHIGFVALIHVAITVNAVVAEELDVTISPATDSVVTVDGSVSFSCSPSGGCPPYTTYSWSFDNASGNPPTDQQNPGDVAFGSSAEGKKNKVKVTVTDSKPTSKSAETYVLVPKVEIISADVESDEIKYKATPAELTGKLKLIVKGDVDVVIFDENVSGSSSEQIQTFNIANKFTASHENKNFNQIKAEWTPKTGVTAEDIKSLGRDFRYLGVWSITNYFTPQEGGYGGATLSNGTGTLSGTTWSNLSNVSHPIAFMNAVDPANEGLGVIGTTVVRFHSTFGNTSATPWTALNGGANMYLANPDPDQQTASCPPFNLIGTTDTIAASSSQLSCNDEVIIQDVGKKVRRDTGGGLGSTQIDVYIGEGGATLNQQANTWGNQSKWVIKLL